MRQSNSPRKFLAGLFVLTVLAVPVVLLAIVPNDSGLLSNYASSGFSPLTINAGQGDQYHPHVDGNLVSYTSDNNVRYYDWFTGTDAEIPGTPAFDWLSDVSGGKIAFTRTGSDGGFDVYVYDTATHVATAVAPSSSSDRYFPSIGGNTVAFTEQPYGIGTLSSSKVLVADLSAPSTAISLTDGTRVDGMEGVSVSPAGDVIVWHSCGSGGSDSTTCDIYKAIRVGTSWVVSAVTTNTYADLYPRTDGTVITYVSIRGGEQDIYWQPVGGGTEQRLAIPGEQRSYPSVAGGVIAFETVAVGGGTAADVYVYHIATNRLFRITSTPNDEVLSDIAVLPDGSYRVVWTGGDHFNGQGDVYGVTFTLPPVATFSFGGFVQPVDPYPTVNTMKAGAAVAVKFSLGGFRGLDIFAAGYPQSQLMTCNSTLEAPVEQTVTAGGSSLSYDATTDLYSYVWKTDRTWAGTCRQLVIQFTDSSIQRANFKFK